MRAIGTEAAIISPIDGRVSEDMGVMLPSGSLGVKGRARSGRGALSDAAAARQRLCAVIPVRPTDRRAYR
ncbi:hypothetical protein San01_02640 [Streptomyces angustmyceticus]|uniref:Uncharacterized protein n=1 Tax=Streptomyces angustmyceticus TaxID=285578 RepID=A0A5J4L045_9ACTN|nr:hypothetical protein San01_02640 [Streptomyces angustmyceticus]